MWLILVVSYPRQPRLKPPAHNPSRIACQKPTGLPMITSLEPTKYSFINSLFTPKKNKIRKKSTYLPKKKARRFGTTQKFRYKRQGPLSPPFFGPKNHPFTALVEVANPLCLALGRRRWSLARLACHVCDVQNLEGGLMMGGFFPTHFEKICGSQIGNHFPRGKNKKIELPPPR